MRPGVFVECLVLPLCHTPAWFPPESTRGLDAPQTMWKLKWREAEERQRRTDAEETLQKAELVRISPAILCSIAPEAAAVEPRITP